MKNSGTIGAGIAALLIGTQSVFFGILGVGLMATHSYVFGAVMLLVFALEVAGVGVLLSYIWRESVQSKRAPILARAEYEDRALRAGYTAVGMYGQYQPPRWY